MRQGMTVTISLSSLCYWHSFFPYGHILLILSRDGGTDNAWDIVPPSKTDV